MGFKEGYDVTSRSLYDREAAQRMLEEDILASQAARKVSEGNLLLAQQEAAQKAAAWKAQQEQMKRLEAAVAGQPTAGLTMQEAPAAAPQDALSGRGEYGDPSGMVAEPAPLPGAEPPLPPKAPPGQVPGVAPQQPLIEFFRANPNLVTPYSLGDATTQNKVLEIFNKSQWGPEGSRRDTNNIRDYERALADGSTTLGFNDWLLQQNRALGGAEKGEAAWSVGYSTDANTRRTEYLTEGKDAEASLTDYGMMYDNVLMVSTTGAIADLRLGIRKLAHAVGMGEELAEKMTGIKEGDIGAWEKLRAWTMTEVFKKIAQTKGAISEREMNAFTQASAGTPNTQLGNIMLIEGAMYRLRGISDRAEYIRRHTKRSGGVEGFEAAELAWRDQVELEKYEKEATIKKRMRLIARTNPAELRVLMANRDARPMQKAFYTRWGWLPDGYKVDPKWKVKGK